MDYTQGRTTAPALDTRIRKTLTNTFIALSGMWVLTAATSFITRGMHFGLGVHLALFVASLITLFATRAFRNSGFGVVLLGVFSSLQGVTLGPLLQHYAHMASGPQVITLAAMLTAVATAGCAMYCITTRKSFSHLGGFLFAGLLMLLVAMIANIFIQSTVFSLVISCIACLVFLGYMLYDLSAVVRGEETSYVSAAIGVYLDMFNLFLHLLRLLGVLGSDD